ncbi:MAG: type II toxin-antitoxin system RelE/ParE family toxin [Chloroflexi bacterium]|nr:type II toxin-antitoxin system RelE/ParE family toxin [Chloroflexota bacterium]
MNYSYRVSGAAERYFGRLDAKRRRLVHAKILEICEDPYAPQFPALHGRTDGVRRARCGSLRILYSVDDEVRIVDVAEIGPRGDVYKGS